MSRKKCKLQPGHLNTREERRILRLLARDLEIQAARAANPERQAEIISQLEAVKREQAYDRQVSPRSKKQAAKARKGGRR